MTSRLPILAVLAGMTLMGCQQDTPATKPDTISYFQNTGLCFAAVDSYTYSGYKVISIANVPCTQQVLDAINGGNKP